MKQIKRQKYVIVGLAILGAVFLFQYAYAQSGKSAITLNSPVSFPVDI